MKKLITIVLCILLTLSLAAAPDKVRLISIGIDYLNTGEDDMVLDGTINDATEMAAAVQSVMEAKGVEFESVVMLQEGRGDYYVEITVHDEGKDLKLLNDVENVLITVNADSTDTTEYELGDDYYLVRDRMDENTLEEVYSRLEDLTDWEDVDFTYFDIKETPSYPSSDNVINEILLASDLDYDDLLIVYYSGHGGTYHGFTSFDMENLLMPYVRNGSLTRSEMNEVLDLDTIIEDTVMDRLASLGVEEETILKIIEDMEESEEYYPTGVLATAYTYDSYYSDCSSLEMYMLYASLSLLKCDSVLILDACFSGYASDNLSDYLDESDYDHAVNIEVMSASRDDETSVEYGYETEDGEWEYHGAFTYEVLSALGWEHSREKKTIIDVPFYTVDEDDSVVDIRSSREVNGYISFIPERQTADEFFSNVLDNWDIEDQHPQEGESSYLLYFIP